MDNTLVWPADCTERIVDTYGNMLFRLCLIRLGNSHDAEDAVQETLMKYLQKKPEFENAQHEKAWLLTVASNKCRDILRYRNRHPEVDYDEINAFTQDSSDCGILDALVTLPDKYKTVLYLYYVEEYSMEHIADMIGRSLSAVKMRMQKGRRLLAETYRKEWM